jgi:hypothetical protein
MVVSRRPHHRNSSLKSLIFSLTPAPFQQVREQFVHRAFCQASPLRPLLGVPYARV